MTKHLLLTLALAAGSAAALCPLAAHADPTISVAAAPPGTAPFSLVDFGSSAATGDQQAGGPIVKNGETFTFTGGSNIYSGGTMDVAQSPFGSGSDRNYLAAQPGGTLLITLNSLQTGFNLLWGTVDTYNSVTFSGPGGSQTISGAELANDIPGFKQGTYDVAVQLRGLSAFDTVSVASAMPAFEFDPGTPLADPAAPVADPPTPVPEPGSLALLGTALIGFGAVGWRRRRS